MDNLDPDLDVTPITVGFDLRVHDMSVLLPSSTRSVRYEQGGKTYMTMGTMKELSKTLREAGYTVIIK